MNLPRLSMAGLAAGVWVTVSGMLMALTFGYREMKVAFDAAGLAVPQGLGPLITHTLVRLAFGVIIVALYAIMVRVWQPGRAMVAAAAFAWLLATVLPYAVIAQWGLFRWSLAAKFWAWGAAEFLIAAFIGRLLYRV
jgi:hypothetical protein